MPGFRNRRIGLLVLALLLSGLFITSPWKEPQPEGAPFPNTIKGPHWGVDITGGTRIMLHLKAKRATIKFPDNVENYLNYGQDVLQRFEKNLNPPVRRLSTWKTVRNTGELPVEIGAYVDDNLITSLLKNGESLEKSVKTVAPQTQEKVKNSLKMRVDPSGTLGAQFKPMGGKNQFLQFEVSLPKEKAKRLLGKEGLPEVFIDNKRTIWSKHLKHVTRRLGDEGWEVSFSLSKEGQDRFAAYTGGKEGIENKTGHAGVIYLDRPTDSVLLFTQEFADNVRDQAPTLLGDKEENPEAYLTSGKADYSERAHKFWFKPADRIRSSYPENFKFYIQVPAAKIEDNKVPEDSATFIKSLKRQGEITQGIILGKKKTFSENLIQEGKLVINGSPVLSVENVARRKVEGQGKKELAISLLQRVCGVKSWPTLEPSVVGTPSRRLRITTGRGQSGKKEAEDLRIILSQRLPVEVEHVSEETMNARLGEAFLKQAAIAGGAAFILVGVLVYFFFRRFKIAIPLLLTMASEVIITLGAASAVPDGLMSIGLPGIGGLIAVIGTGVDHQIIIADEVLGKKFSASGKLPIDRRTGKAFSIIFAAAATTIAAMFALATFGFGRMRGFAIVTLFGVLVSVLITRPAYARIIGTLLEKEQKEKSGGS